MKQKDFTSSPRRWPRRIRTVVLLLLCLALLLGGLLLPRELCRWIERQQFDRVVQLDGTSTGADPLNFSQRLELVTVMNSLNYSLDESTSFQSENRVQTASSSFDGVINGVDQLARSTGLPYFDTDLTAWAKSISGFDDERGKPIPTTSLVLDRLTGQGAVFWYVGFYWEDSNASCSATVDDETGLLVQYHYYNPNLDVPMDSVDPVFMETLASGLQDYWGLKVLEVQELSSDAYGADEYLGRILFSDENGSTVQIVVTVGPNYFSINQINGGSVEQEHGDALNQPTAMDDNWMTFG